MTRILLVLFAFLLGVDGALAATIAAKPFALINGNVVRLGDIFTDVGDKADVPVGQAPPLGRSLTLDAAALTDIARANQLEWRAFSRFDKVVIERASQSVEAEQIVAALRETLARAGIGQNHDVQLDTRNLRMVVAAGTAPTVEIRDFRYDDRSERFTAQAAIVGDMTNAPLSLAGQAVRVIETPTLVRRINRGEVIQAHDVRMARIRAATVPAEALMRTEAIVGKAARRALAPGESIRGADLQAPVVVEKGSAVTVVVQTPYMVLTTQGRALEDGAMGETIRVMNSRSKKIVEAQVAKSDTVVVQVAVLNTVE